ncbi:MAG TPA: D-alanyl-D-alanine carboxypeptidase family protein [Gammaproteobacteria bacterium]|nr:D-alanyl-D-alanine carboxypeptidase family protein [Gammaproteobacteria bacterium]
MHPLSPRLGILLVALLSGMQAAAQPPAVPVPAAPEVNAGGYLLVDHHSGRVLASKNDNEHFEPASLTKLMTAYVVFKKLEEGAIALDDPVLVSETAWRTGGSRSFVDVNTRVPLVDLLQGMIVQSGNDATVALAEHVAGSEATFAALMNEHARSLGMSGTNFTNSTGWPDPNHYTTASDLAELTAATIDEFPDYYHWYAQKEYTWNNIKQHNRNQLLWRDPSVDGLKTGHTQAAGYCLVASAERDGMRLTSVILGSSGEQVRTAATQALLNYGFSFYETRRLYEAGKEITTTPVFKGDREQAALGIERDLYVTVPRGRFRDLEATVEIQNPVLAPVDPAQALGRLSLSMNDEIVAERPLHSLAAIGAGSLWRRMVDEMRLWFL